MTTLSDDDLIAAVLEVEAKMTLTEWTANCFLVKAKNGREVTHTGLLGRRRASLPHENGGQEDEDNAAGIAFLRNHARDLCERLKRAGDERDELARRAREVTCVWCGHQFESTLQSQAEHLYEHAKTCVKHPIRELEAQRDRWKAEAIQHRDKSRGDYWAWQGDGSDHLESLVCPVLISAAALLKLQSECVRAREGAGPVDTTGNLWSFLRGVLEQGGAIYCDHREKTYEEHSARLDAAARELEPKLLAALKIPIPIPGEGEK